MATSSITRNFVVSGTTQVEIFADAIEQSAKNRKKQVEIKVNKVQGADELRKLMMKRKKANEGV